MTAPDTFFCECHTFHPYNPRSGVEMDHNQDDQILATQGEKRCSCETYTGSERINGIKCCERCGKPL